MRNQIRWTPELIKKLKKFWLQGLTKTEMARELNVPRASLVIKCLDLNLVGNPVMGGKWKPRTPEEDKKYWEKKNKDKEKSKFRSRRIREQLLQEGKHDSIKHQQNEAVRKVNQYNYDQFLKGDRYHYWKYRLRQIKSSVKNRYSLKNLPFTVTPEYLEKLWLTQGGKCALTDIILKPALATPTRDSKANLISLDRIDNNKGYEIGNLRFISFLANTIKSTLSDDVLLQVARGIVKKLTKEKK